MLKKEPNAIITNVKNNYDFYSNNDTSNIYLSYEKINENNEKEEFRIMDKDMPKIFYELTDIESQLDYNSNAYFPNYNNIRLYTIIDNAFSPELTPEERQDYKDNLIKYYFRILDKVEEANKCTYEFNEDNQLVVTVPSIQYDDSRELD